MNKRQFDRSTRGAKLTPFSGVSDLLKAYANSREIDRITSILMEERGWSKKEIQEAQAEGHLYNPDRDTVIAHPEWGGMAK